MKRLRIPRLTLNKSTVRILTNDQLDAIGGGGPTGATETCSFQTCSSTKAFPGVGAELVTCQCSATDLCD